MNEINEMEEKLDDICRNYKQIKELIDHQETLELLTGLKVERDANHPLIDKIFEYYCENKKINNKRIKKEFSENFRSRIEIFCYVWETSDDAELKKEMLELYTKIIKETDVRVLK